jgi:hypothetical protein
VGDLVDTGASVGQWSKIKASFNDHLGRLRLIAVMGNHEAYTLPSTDQAIRFEEATNQTTSHHTQ